MAKEGGAGQRRSQHDKARAARMKQQGVTRTTGRCAVCYRIIVVDSWKSRYSHICR